MCFFNVFLEIVIVNSKFRFDVGGFSACFFKKVVCIASFLLWDPLQILKSLLLRTWWML